MFDMVVEWEISRRIRLKHLRKDASTISARIYLFT